MKKIPLLIIFLFLASLVSGELNLIENQDQPDIWPCEEFKTIQKTFNAESEDIKIGMMCPQDAKIKVFDCNGEECLYAIEAYKNKNQLPLFSGFEINQRYSYQCFACEKTCALSVNEKETIDLQQFFQGVEFKVKSAPSKLDKNGRWSTTTEDLGQYNVVIDVKNNAQWEEVRFCIEIKENNQPPRLNIKDKKITIKEGQTLKLDLGCEDDQEANLAISGWMDSLERKISYDDAGVHHIEVSCLNQQGLGEKDTIIIEVLNTNRPPVIEWSVEIGE